MNLKRLIVLTLVLCVVAGGTSFAKTKITFWHAMSGDLGEAIDYLTEQFNAENPEIEVESIYQGRYSDLNTKIVASVSAQVTPTLAQVYENWTDAYIRNGLLVPMEDYMDLTEEEFNDYTEVYRSMNTWEDKLYTIPLNKSNWILHYNTELVPEPPRTVEEFLQISREVTEKTGGETKGFGMRPTLELFHDFLYLNGADFLDDDLNVTFNGPEGVAALKLMLEMIEDDSALLIDGYENEAFGDRMIAMYIGSSAGMPHVVGSVGDKFEFRTASLPTGVRPGAPFMGTNVALFKAASEEERKAAGKFMRFMTNTENTVYFAIKTGYLPVTYSGLESAEYQQFIADNPHLAAIADEEALAHGYWQPRIGAWEQARGAIYEAVEKVFLGVSTVQEALDEAAFEVEEAIEEMLTQRY